jgi:hypothetical protein
VIEMAAGVCRDEPKPDRRHGRRAAGCIVAFPAFTRSLPARSGNTHELTRVHLSAASKNRGTSGKRTLDGLLGGSDTGRRHHNEAPDKLST